MTVLIDIDSTITNFAEVLLKYLNEQYSTHYSINDITHWNWFTNTFASPWKPLELAQFWNEVQVMPEAVSAIKTIQGKGAKVYLVTASFFTDTLGLKIRNVLKEFNGALTEHNVIVAQNKSLILGDVMIDDNIENLKTCRCPRKILFKQPWNRHKRTTFIPTNDWYSIPYMLEPYL
jgi:5'(3')-deoxyribonucleotidase